MRPKLGEHISAKLSPQLLRNSSSPWQTSLLDLSYFPTHNHPRESSFLGPLTKYVLEAMGRRSLFPHARPIRGLILAESFKKSFYQEAKT
jgi:hypothetical protein